MLFINAFRSCSMYSMTMKMSSSRLPTTTSLTSTMFLCFKDRRMLISLIEERGKPSFSACILICFSAQMVPLSLSLALHIETTSSVMPFKFVTGNEEKGGGGKIIKQKIVLNNNGHHACPCSHRWDLKDSHVSLLSLLLTTLVTAVSDSLEVELQENRSLAAFIYGLR